jgi:hypothetical protein
MEDERIRKKVLNGKFLTKEQWENQDQDGRMFRGGTHHRSWEYEDGGDQQNTETNVG